MLAPRRGLDDAGARAQREYHYMTDTCYLCGDPITEDQSQDHIPPKQFFAPQIRNPPPRPFRRS